jgi:hypothetical protein
MRGFPNRMPYPDFCNRYNILEPHKVAQVRTANLLNLGELAEGTLTVIVSVFLLMISMEMVKNVCNSKNAFYWISTQGFPNRMLYPDFCNRYNILEPTRGQCCKTFYRGNLPPFHGHTVILCYKTLLSLW